MRGIAGLVLKDASLEPRLGDMLITQTDPRSDSAGIAIHISGKKGQTKRTVQSDTRHISGSTLHRASIVWLGWQTRNPAGRL